MKTEPRTNEYPAPRTRESLTSADMAQITNAVEQMTAPEQRHVVGQATMADERIARLVALFVASDERGKKTLMAIAGIQADYARVKP